MLKYQSIFATKLIAAAVLISTMLAGVPVGGVGSDSMYFLAIIVSEMVATLAVKMFIARYIILPSGTAFRKHVTRVACEFAEGLRKKGPKVLRVSLMPR